MVADAKEGKTPLELEKPGADEKVQDDNAMAAHGEDDPSFQMLLKSVPAPATTLAVAPIADLGKLTVSLTCDADVVPDLDEVQRINLGAQGESRTPLMTVIEAILGSKGGSTTLRDLCELANKYWNRPFPTSPYSNEEFIYIMVSHSDNLRIGV
jgi:hypothetical protein